MEYTWRSGWQVANLKAVSAQTFGERVEAIRQKLGDEISPADVVEEAKPKTSPIHLLFEWQDKTAAHKWREHQARNALNSLRIVVVDHQAAEPRTVIANVAITSHDQRRTYVPSIVAAGDDYYRQQMLQQALNYLKGFESRYKELAEVEPVLSAISQVAQNIQEQINQEPQKQAV